MQRVIDADFFESQCRIIFVDVHHEEVLDGDRGQVPDGDEDGGSSVAKEVEDEPEIKKCLFETGYLIRYD
jgi:hypothetical protein